MVEQKTIPTLYNLASSAGFRCLWALEEIQLANPSFQYKLVNYPRTTAGKDMRQHHRLGKSPVMTLEWTDGSSAPPPTVQIEPGVLTEAKLILEFINQEYGDGIWDPRTEEDRRREDFFRNFASSSVQMKTDFVLIHEVFSQMIPFPFNTFFWLAGYPARARFKKDLQEIFQLLEDHLSEEKPWFGGEAIGVADLNMSFGMDMADQRGYFEREKYPKLRGWCERVRSREGYQKALEKGGGYDLKTYGMKQGWALVFGGAK